MRYGWTTGACATAATAAACHGLWCGVFPDPMRIELPRGRTPEFGLAFTESTPGQARAGVVKDAGDDPDVTHGATVVSTVWSAEPGAGVIFHAGAGVGTVTKPGLPLSVGEPAINPVPRKLITQAVTAAAAEHSEAADLNVEISVPDGEKIAEHTWNPRLGILGGLSILGTTGVVVPYSCSAWIDSIRRGIDVARAVGIDHVVGATGSTSETTARDLYDLPTEALLDMGDFAGAVLKYMRRHPVPRLTLAGGFAKLSKLAAGHLDLHSKRSQVDRTLLAELAEEVGANDDLVHAITTGNTALRALELAQESGIPLGDVVASRARRIALQVLDGTPVAVDVIAIDRSGTIVGRAGP